ncbi:DUF1254 domain-containing protein [Pseudomonas sp. S9]|uniref:DUF1254 domain-containing protein n=1 Tax=Pseudomonas sp. S9 TaxID=686578 RepID=UPI001300BF26|nr:DUF1254 domain-containing protein [Pseudomonas sp. S9]
MACTTSPQKTDASGPGSSSGIEYRLGVPTPETAARMFDELAYQRAVQVYLWGLPAVGMQQYRIANAQGMGGGSDVYKVGYLGDQLKSNLLHLTGNPDSMYIDYFFDTKSGPIALEVPASLPGFIDDMWELPVIDVIPQVSKNGKYLIVPPGWNGKEPNGFVVVRPRTYVSWMLLRGPVQQVDGKPDTTGAVTTMRKQLKIYPVNDQGVRKTAPALQFFNMSDKQLNRVPPEGLAYFQRLAEVVSNESKSQTDAYMMGTMHTLGIEAGKPFEPDERMQKILTRAAETGQAMARSIAFHGKIPGREHWPDRQYAEAFMGGSPSFETDGRSNLDERTLFFYLACGTSKLMASTTPGVGQAYPWAVKDAKGNTFDGGKTYKMHLPKDIPAKLYWSVTAYDTVTRSQIQNGTDFARVSTFTQPEPNSDGSIDLYFGPTAPAGKEKNWVKTVPDQGWFFLFRLEAQPVRRRTGSRLCLTKAGFSCSGCTARKQATLIAAGSQTT